jgi:hypothetical protein
MTRYSQNDEQDVILKFFDGKRDGTLLDLGAFDGSTFSNSRALIESFDWKAIMIEPSPWPFGAMTQLYWNNPRVGLINAVVVPKITKKVIPFWVTPDAVSCADKSVTHIWGGENNFRQVWMAPIDVWSLPQHEYDFVTIDVEDNTMGLVNEMIDTTKFLHHAKLVCLEHTAGGVSCGPQMITAMSRIGKRVIHTTGENYIFA